MYSNHHRCCCTLFSLLILLLISSVANGEEQGTCENNDEGTCSNNSAATESKNASTSNTSMYTRSMIEEMVDNEFPNLTEIDFNKQKLKQNDDNSCVDKNGITKNLPIKLKQREQLMKMSQSPNKKLLETKVAKYICQLDVSEVTKYLLQNFDETFDEKLQEKTNAYVSNRGLDKSKPGVGGTIFIYSDFNGEEVFHYPWLQDWLPLLQKHILEPLHIPLNHITRMQLALMSSPEATINQHSDNGMWAGKTHRTHVPLITHDDIYFIANLWNEYINLRIPSKVGTVFEFNNKVPHAVRNYGGVRVHLIIDWSDTPINEITKLNPGQVCIYKGPQGVFC